MGSENVNKLKISIEEGSFEISGSEKFVKRQLKHFKDVISDMLETSMMYYEADIEEYFDIEEDEFFEDDFEDEDYDDTLFIQDVGDEEVDSSDLNAEVLENEEEEVTEVDSSDLNAEVLENDKEEVSEEIKAEEPRKEPRKAAKSTKATSSKKTKKKEVKQSDDVEVNAGDEIDPDDILISGNIPGKNTTAKTQNAALLYAYARKMQGNNNASLSEVRNIAEIQGFLDANNFSTYIRAKDGIWYKDTGRGKKRTIKLNKAGVQAAEELIETINQA